MKKKFLILKSGDLSQIQMWLNQKEASNGGVEVVSPLSILDNYYVIVISFNEQE